MHETANNRYPILPFVLIGLGVLCLAVGSYFGLFVAPPERYMGEVQRIMYVHVPTAWNALLAITFAFVCAIVFLKDIKIIPLLAAFFLTLIAYWITLFSLSQANERRRDQI